MAQAGQQSARRKGKTGATAPAPTASPVLPSLQKEQLLALVRAMARDAARADHAAEQQG
ncbi:hypothetical protein [Paracoccus siganidrum]|uniref:hypothetical protein n=1 Tax=Paracoccus siganidrum TaxID=1276757 RepID=UPI001474C2FF|nr:hypothetical protein [Paracoccus siganidrum]